MSTLPSTRFVPVDEFRKEHELGRDRVYKAIARGEIPHVKVGRKILIPADALDRMLTHRPTEQDVKGAVDDAA